MVDPTTHTQFLTHVKHGARLGMSKLAREVLDAHGAVLRVRYEVFGSARNCCLGSTCTHEEDEYGMQSARKPMLHLTECRLPVHLAQAGDMPPGGAVLLGPERRYLPRAVKACALRRFTRVQYMRIHETRVIEGDEGGDYVRCIAAALLQGFEPVVAAVLTHCNEPTTPSSVDRLLRAELAGVVRGVIGAVKIFEHAMMCQHTDDITGLLDELLESEAMNDTRIDGWECEALQ